MPSNNYNNRLPDLQKPGEYPYVRFYQYRDGSWDRQDEYPGNESHAKGHISGTHYEVDNTGSHKMLSVGFGHNYVQQGYTTTVEYNHDLKISGSEAQFITQDHYKEQGGDHMIAVGNNTIHASKGTHFIHSTASTEITSTGDHVTDHNDGNHHINVKGNNIKFTGNNKYDYVGGDDGKAVANNHDTNVGQNYNITIGANGTISAGQSFKITVGGTVVTITNASVDVKDGNGNEFYMDANTIYLNPHSLTVNTYLGGNGTNGVYALASSVLGPAANVYLRIG